MSAAEPLPDLEIQPMRRHDLDDVEVIERLSFTAPWSRRSFAGLLGRADADLWVGTVDGSLVGYAVVWYMLGEAELGNLAVSPEWRGRGIGGRLLEFAVEKARERGTRRIYLEVRMSNEVARSLYEARGFQQIGVRKRYYRSPVEDARVMGLELGGGG